MHFFYYAIFETWPAARNRLGKFFSVIQTRVQEKGAPIFGSGACARFNVPSHMHILIVSSAISKCQKKKYPFFPIHLLSRNGFCLERFFFCLHHVTQMEKKTTVVNLEGVNLKSEKLLQLERISKFQIEASFQFLRFLKIPYKNCSLSIQ